MDQVRASAFLDFLTYELPSRADGKRVDMETRIEDFGIDSLEFIDLLQEIEKNFGRVPDEKVAKIFTVRELWDAIPA